MHEIDFSRLSSEEFREHILSEQRPIAVRRSDQERYFLLDLKNPGDYTGEANYVMHNLMQLYSGRSLLVNPINHNHQIDLLQGRTGDKAFAIFLEVGDEGEIQGWNPELFVKEEDFYWWRFVTNPDVIQPYLEAQVKAGNAIQWVNDYIYARISDSSDRLMNKPRNEEALAEFRLKYSEYLKENPDMENVLTPAMKAITDAFSKFTK